MLFISNRRQGDTDTSGPWTILIEMRGQQSKEVKKKSCGLQPQLTQTFTALGETAKPSVQSFSREVVKKQEGTSPAKGVIDQEKHYKEKLSKNLFNGR